MSALGCFGRFTLFSPRVSHSNTCRPLSFGCFVLLFGFVALVCFCFLFFALLCFWFLFCKCLGIPNSPRSLDLDDRQGLIARSAMQQKKKKKWLRFILQMTNYIGLPLPGCASPWIVIGTSLDVTSSLPSSFTPSRPVVVKLRLRSSLSGIANCFTRMFKLTTFC